MIAAAKWIGKSAHDISTCLEYGFEQVNESGGSKTKTTDQGRFFFKWQLDNMRSMNRQIKINFLQGSYNFNVVIGHIQFC